MQTPQELFQEHMTLTSQLPTMPLNDALNVHYPGIDPFGHCSKIDLDFADRMSKVEARMQLMPDPIKTFYNNSKKRGELDDLSSEMLKQSQIYNIAEDLHTFKARRDNTPALPYMEKLMKNAETSPAVQNYEAFVHQMEYLTGLRPDKPDMSQQQTLNEIDLSAGSFIYDYAGKISTNIPKLAVRFENSENWEIQQKISVSAHLSRGMTPALEEMKENFLSNNTESLNLEYSDLHLQLYSHHSVSRAMDGFFSGSELEKNNLDRNDLLFINGKSINQLLEQDGIPEAERHNPMADGLRSAYVTSALMTGARVSVFQISPDGQINPAPIPVVKEGYEPTPMNKPHMNAWENFWSKRGFYKEKANQLQQYNKEQEMIKAEMETIRETNRKNHPEKAENNMDMDEKKKEAAPARSK